MKITVLGAGGWGIGIGMSAERNGHQVALWSPFENEVSELVETRENKKLLQGVTIPKTIAVTTDFSVAEGSDITIIAVPSIAVRETAKRIGTLKSAGIVVNVSKGLESGSLKSLSTVIKEEVNAPVVVLSGPSHAEEVARKIPTSLVASSSDLSAMLMVVEAFSSESLRIYSNEDMIGVEMGGALKNIIAVAAGVCDGLGLGDNTRAALMTRGLTEIARLGMVLGAKERTFAGLTGLGDLIVTCTSNHSRNHRFGELIGRGEEVKIALSTVGTVEGYYATALAYQLAQKHQVEMPIVTECYRILYENHDVKTAVKHLMLRPSKDEHESLWI